MSIFDSIVKTDVAKAPNAASVSTSAANTIDDQWGDFAAELAALVDKSNNGEATGRAIVLINGLKYLDDRISALMADNDKSVLTSARLKYPHKALELDLVTFDLIHERLLIDERKEHVTFERVHIETLMRDHSRLIALLER
jgi:hypothetical protein